MTTQCRIPPSPNHQDVQGTGVIAFAVIGLAATVLMTAAFLQDDPRPGNVAGPSCSPCIPWDEAHDHVGELVTVRGEVASHRSLNDSDGRPSFVALGNAYPSEKRFDVDKWEEVRAEMVDVPAALLLRGSDACVRGVVQLYEGTPEIVLGAANEIGVCDDLG